MPPVKLSEGSIRWAMKHLLEQKDTDIFPFPIELNIIKEEIDFVVAKLVDKGITEYKWKHARRFIMAKDELSFRIVSQLDPVDSLFLAALIKEKGQIIEDARIPETDGIIFGNRFAPSNEGHLYKSDRQWKKYWTKNKARIEEFHFAVSVDIADFYNQIYHHTVENSIIEVGGSNQLKNSIKNFIGK